MTKTCSKCGNIETNDQAVFCDKCGTKLSIVDEIKPNEIKPTVKHENIIQEYRRTCKNCGKVWHSLVSRERELNLRATTSKLSEIGTRMQAASCCFMCGDRGAAQYGRNVDATKNEIERLKSCPNCLSKNYTEEIIPYEKK